MKKLYLFLVFAFFFSLFQAQTLKPSIGLSSVPQNTDPICNIPTYTGSFYTSGISAGDTMADFTLYTLAGDTVNLAQELQDKKPILLVTGSYTCPVFRNKMVDLDNVASTYGNALKIFIVYVVEAHPDIDVSPYSGTVWTTGQNQQDGVLYRQPTTYGERKAVVDSMINNMGITHEILIDGPCNEWWNYYGPAPNNSYLVDTNGIVFTKHGWFDKAPDDIFCDIDSLFGNPPCTPPATGGTFIWKLDNDSTTNGAPGQVLSVKGKLINNSNASASIEIIRLQNNVPTGWSSAMCVDICLADWVDTTTFILAAQDTQSYTMYFYTDLTASASGQTTIGFRNTAVQNNRFRQNFYANTWATGINNHQKNGELKVYPNPNNGAFTVSFDNVDDEKYQLIIYDVSGKRVLEDFILSSQKHIHFNGFEKGVYFIELYSAHQNFYQKIIVE